MSDTRAYTPEEVARELAMRVGLGERFELRQTSWTPTQQWIRIERIDDGVSWSQVFRVATACGYVPIEGEQDAIVFAGSADCTRQQLEQNGPDEGVPHRTQIE